MHSKHAEPSAHSFDAMSGGEPGDRALVVLPCMRDLSLAAKSLLSDASQRWTNFALPDREWKAPRASSSTLALEAGDDPRAEHAEHKGGQRRNKQKQRVLLGSFSIQAIDDFIYALVLLIASGSGGILENKLSRG
jgi:hypothetical protein